MDGGSASQTEKVRVGILSRKSDWVQLYEKREMDCVCMFFSLFRIVRAS